MRRHQALLVDDDSAIRETLSVALSGEYLVHAVATGDEACQVLALYPIAAIILDAVLAHESGLDLVERFRSLSVAPITLLTGHSSEELAIRAVRAHIDEYVKKPVHLQELRAVLARLTGMREEPAHHAHRHLWTAPITFSTCRDLAAHVGLSERHLRRLFAATYGKSPRRIAAERRLAQAAHLLVATDLPVDQIAQNVGYRSGRFLARAFKAAHGMTPTAYRAQHSAEGPTEAPPPEK